ncbi:nose resistant to fluoxetine protein 6-like [Schistocerca piceifrons]|uniref:nose resistant to fluoxetine protein 6-like n=1 Tax=Schistocerca piceifrons TaxID=274613 RepID=UPI001F5E9D07|nr:nose resistant to fluoxetine protein 6-like [Schistocerca piceifrons]
MWRLAVLAVLAVSAAAAEDAFLAQESLLYALAAAAPPGASNSSCSGQLSQLRDAAERRHVWALKMLDASGTPGAAFLWGNNYWLGSRSQCETIPLREPLVLSRDLPKPPLAWPPYPIHFSVASFRHNATLQVHVGLPNEDLIVVGLCLPASCPAKEVAELLDAAFLSNPIYIQKMYNMSFSRVQVESLKEDDSWVSEQTFVTVEVLLTFVAVIVILGTAYDVIIWQPHLREITAHGTSQKTKVHSVKENMEVAITNPKIHENNNDNSYSNNYSEKTDCYTSKSTSSTREKIVQGLGPLNSILVCFSIYSNVPIILDTQLGCDSVPAIHGLRFMGMGWIIMVHTVFYLSDYADNKPQAFYLSEGFMVQVVSNSTLSVDTFFFLSGFLVSYLYYQGKQGKKPSQETCGSKIVEFITMVLRRIIRLTPAYMAVIGIAILNMKWHSQKTLFHMTERADVICPKYWWRNLLYINNLFDREEMCLSWSWYLSNDMQFFIIASFLLILSSSYFLLSAIILGSLIVASSAVTFYSSYINSYIPVLDQQFAMLSTLYDPPWTRIGPHLVGVATGYIVIYLKGKLILKKRTLLMAWLLGSTFNVITLFGLYNRNIPVTAAALYVALSRTAWALGISWIIIACCTNNAGIINSILSFRGWIPLSRLTYCVYLLNPLLMNSMYLDSETAMHVEFLPLAAYFFGHVGVSFFCAFVLSLTFETPNVLLMRWLLGCRSKNQKANARAKDCKATSV